MDGWAGYYAGVHLFCYLQELLDEMHRRGKLNSLSLWKELYPLFNRDDRYHDMLGQPGRLLGVWQGCG